MVYVSAWHSPRHWLARTHSVFALRLRAIICMNSVGQSSPCLSLMMSNMFTLSTVVLTLHVQKKAIGARRPKIPHVPCPRSYTHTLCLRFPHIFFRLQLTGHVASMARVTKCTSWWIVMPVKFWKTSRSSKIPKLREVYLARVPVGHAHDNFLCNIYVALRTFCVNSRVRFNWCHDLFFADLAKLSHLVITLTGVTLTRIARKSMGACLSLLRAATTQHGGTRPAPDVMLCAARERIALTSTTICFSNRVPFMTLSRYVVKDVPSARIGHRDCPPCQTMWVHGGMAVYGCLRSSSRCPVATRAGIACHASCSRLFARHERFDLCGDHTPRIMVVAEGVSRSRPSPGDVPRSVIATASQQGRKLFPLDVAEAFVRCSCECHCRGFAIGQKALSLFLFNPRVSMSSMRWHWSTTKCDVDHRGELCTDAWCNAEWKPGRQCFLVYTTFGCISF